MQVSNFHFREKTNWDSAPILTQLRGYVKNLVAVRPIDLVLVTGDVAYSGKPAEYDLALAFFEGLLGDLELKPRWLLLVPGNHDVDRTKVSFAAMSMQNTVLEKQPHQDNLSEILKHEANSQPLLARHQAWLDFLCRLKGGDHPLPNWRETLTLKGLSFAFGRPTRVNLKDMYLPLRLGKGYDPRELDEGAMLTPGEIPDLSQPLLIRGPAGCGKTTWMRQSFRKLLGLPECLPIMLELRKLAKYWSARQDAGHNLDLTVFLEEEVLKPTLMEDCKGKMHLLFGASSGPIPVLLVDGWDELGDLGRELRTRLLTLARKYPCLRIVATSRPAADRMPATAERYTVCDLQPLNDAEVLAFAGNFCTHCHPGDTAAKQAALATFEDALAKAEDAAELTRNPLLLTMMLFVNRTRPLPDKRFQLYEACVENLVADLPAEKQREGARPMRTHWCPPDRDARLRVLGRLAHDLQTNGYKVGRRAVAVVQREELAEMLPRDWREVERYGFIAWLVERAGLLVDRTDGSLTFVHLSFQEFLTAHYLKRSLEGDQNRLQMVHAHVGDQQWWETLRLWAALEDREEPERIDALSGSLVKDAGDAFWLMGAFFADGLGNEEAFGEWADRAVIRVAVGCEFNKYQCAGFWNNSRQKMRRAHLEAKLVAMAQSQNWPSIFRVTKWASDAGYNPVDWKRYFIGSQQILQRFCWTQDTYAPKEIARARFLMGCHPTWGGGSQIWTLLRCWPGPRLLIGPRLQNMVAFGFREKDLSKVLTNWQPVMLKDKMVNHCK